MSINDFSSKYLKMTNIKVLEVYQGYLVSGRSKSKQNQCLWVNRLNIEGLTGVAQIIAIEQGFKALLSLIPLGSFAYGIINDQLGHPPKQNIQFLPEFYEVRYGIMQLSQDDRKGLTGSISSGIENVAKSVTDLGDMVQNRFLKKKEPAKKENATKVSDTEEKVVGFGWISFIDKISLIKTQIIKQNLDKDTSDRSRKIKKGIVQLTPPILASFKSTSEVETLEFIDHLKKMGFTVHEKSSPLLLD